MQLLQLIASSSASIRTVSSDPQSLPVVVAPFGPGPVVPVAEVVLLLASLVSVLAALWPPEPWSRTALPPQAESAAIISAG
jgi:hypothetical protein